MHLVGFITKKFVMKQGHVNVKYTRTFARNVISFDTHCRCEREAARILHKFKLACAEEMELLCWYCGQPHTECIVGNERGSPQPKTAHCNSKLSSLKFKVHDTHTHTHTHSHKCTYRQMDFRNSNFSLSLSPPKIFAII